MDEIQDLKEQLEYKEQEIRKLCYCARLYERKLAKLMGEDYFERFSMQCAKKMLTVEANNYFYGRGEMPED